MQPRPNQERILGMHQDEHTKFGLIVVREFDFKYVRKMSDLLYYNTRPTTLDEESTHG